jgi:hypothetical protein
VAARGTGGEAGDDVLGGSGRGGTRLVGEADDALESVAGRGGVREEGVDKRRGGVVGVEGEAEEAVLALRRRAGQVDDGVRSQRCGRVHDEDLAVGEVAYEEGASGTGGGGRQR